MEMKGEISTLDAFNNNIRRSWKTKGLKILKNQVVLVGFYVQGKELFFFELSIHKIVINASLIVHNLKYIYTTVSKLSKVKQRVRQNPLMKNPLAIFNARVHVCVWRYFNAIVFSYEKNLCKNIHVS